MNLFLTGFMGSGKTVVGRCLAQKLDLPFLDTDAVIEAEAGKTIAEIFAHQGEAVFRRMERTLCKSLPNRHVIALGGGTFVDAQNRASLKKQGFSIFIEWPFSVLADRISGDPNRPLSMDKIRMAERYQARLPVYRHADIVWTSKPPHQSTPGQVADELHELLLAHSDFDLGKT